MANKHEQEIIELFESRRKEYLDGLRSDLKQYREKIAYYMVKDAYNFPRKPIDFRFDEIASYFEEYKVEKVNEEIEILENIDTSLFENLAHIFDDDGFTFMGEKKTLIALWAVNSLMLTPIFNAILSIRKLEQREIDWKNYRRDLTNLQKQLDKGHKLTETFFAFIPMESEEEILRIFFGQMHNIYLDIKCDGIEQIISFIFPQPRERLPKEQKKYMEDLIEDLTMYNDDDYNPDYYSYPIAKFFRIFKR